MSKSNSFLVLSVAISLLTNQAYAECIYLGFSEEEFPHNPIYRIASCTPAQQIVTQRRENNPDWYGEISIAAMDVAIRVTHANDDARKLLPEDSEYWYFDAGCEQFNPGALLLNANLDDWCCDVGPVQDVQCALGGKKLLSFDIQ